MPHKLELSQKKPKVIPNKNRKIINRFGITRIYEPLGWWIRLGWYREEGKRKVQFQTVVRDSDFGNDKMLSLDRAIIIRDHEQQFIKIPERPPNAINPIIRLSLCRDGN